MSHTVEGNLLLNGRHYDQIHQGITEDVGFWLRQTARYGAPVLELACGTGRISIPISKAGFPVTGIDMCHSMLSQAVLKTESQIPVEWVQADVRNFELRRKFPLIIFPFRAIAALLYLEDLESCLCCVRRHLALGGRFIIDAFNPRLDILLHNPQDRFPLREYPDPHGKGTVVVTQSNEYDATSQINKIHFYYQLPKLREEVVERLDLRMYFPQELDALLKHNGFNLEEKAGDYGGGSFQSSSSMQLIVCSSGG